MSFKRRKPPRLRIGCASVYFHHGAWWIYYRDQGKAHRVKSGASQSAAEEQASQIHARLAHGDSSQMVTKAVDLATLRQQFLEHHEHVRKSSLNTIDRYRAALAHLENFFRQLKGKRSLHQLPSDSFVSYLRDLAVSPNGHPHSTKRRLRDAGIRFILEVCCSLFNFAIRQKYLPPYAENPFHRLPWDRLKIEDRKQIFIFDEAAEVAFWNAADRWTFSIHFVLAKTGMRIGELVHLLIEDIDWSSGWLTVRNKLGLGWRVKTGNNRRIPLLQEVVRVLRLVVGARQSGPVFLRQKYTGKVLPMLTGTLVELETVYRHRLHLLPTPTTRQLEMKVAKQVWRDAGVIKADLVRTCFIRTMRKLRRPDATCPKSWRHTFATLLQDNNVDPLIRQLTLGHRPSLQTGLGMTSAYTHTRPETQRQQIETALRQWPVSLVAAAKKLES